MPPRVLMAQQAPRASSAPNSPPAHVSRFSIVEIIKGSFLFAVLCNILSIIKSVNLAVVFNPAAKPTEQLKQQPSKPKKKQTFHKKIRKSKQQQQQKRSLFPNSSTVDGALKKNASVVPCSISSGTSFVPVKSEHDQINWSLADVNIDLKSSTDDLQDFLTNSATCSTISNASPVAHHGVHDNTNLQTIPDYCFQGAKRVDNNSSSNHNNDQRFSGSVISSSDNDDTSLNEIDLEQLADLADFSQFDASSFAAAAAAAAPATKEKQAEQKQQIVTPEVKQGEQEQQKSTVPGIATPELEQLSKSESNTPNKDNGRSSSSSISSSASPEIDSVDYTFSNAILGGNSNGLDDEDLDEENEDDLDDEDLDEDVGGHKAPGTKKNPSKTHACPFCPAEFRIRGYLTRHIKKHAVQKAYRCPFYNPSADHKCHPNGGFSRRDTYKTHLKARHFRYPPGTRSQDRSHVGGKCAICGTTFETNENWVENHIENGQCPGLPVGYQCRSGSSRRKKSKSKFMHGDGLMGGMPAAIHMGIGIQPHVEPYVNNMKAYQMYEQQQRQLQHLHQMQQFQAQQQHQQMFANVNGNADIAQRSISPLEGVYQQRVPQQYIPQQPRHNQIQQHMFDVQMQQAQQVAFQQAQKAAVQAAQMNQQQKQQQQPQPQQQTQQAQQAQQAQCQQQLQFLVEDEDFMALADEYSPSYNNSSSGQSASAEDENQFLLDNELYFNGQQFQFSENGSSAQEQSFEYNGNQQALPQPQMNFFGNPNNGNFAAY